MTEKAKQIINVYVQNVVNDSKSQFENILLNGVTPEMSKDEIYVKMFFNSITLSTDLAVQIIIDLLDSANVLSITSDEKALQKTLLRLRTDTLKN